MNCLSYSSVYVEKGSESFAEAVIQKLKPSDVIYIDNVRLEKDVPENSLAIMRNNGEFLKKCPGTRNAVCCGYEILDTAFGCPYSCSYCYIQSYRNTKAVVLYSNTRELLAGVKRQLLSDSSYHRTGYHRIGTGEFTDSLAYENLYGYAGEIVSSLGGIANVILEFKTKSVNVDNLLDMKRRNNVVLSWSVNAEEISSAEETECPSLTERLKAAGKAQKHGYWIGFHFDPVVFYDGWEKGYKTAIDRIRGTVDAEKVLWISLGMLRFQPALKTIAEGKSAKKIFYGEFFAGLDGKMRYLKQIRVEVLGTLYKYLKERFPNAFIYLCMETDSVWKRALNVDMKDSCQLRDEFNRYVFNRINNS